jgi:hypothetical protein
MPVSFGIPLGIVILLVGVILFFSTNYKRAARLVIGAGAVIAVLTVVLILLAVNSQM